MAFGFNMEGEEGLLGSTGLAKYRTEIWVAEDAMTCWFSLVYWLE